MQDWRVAKKEAESVRRWMLANPDKWFGYNAQKVNPEAIRRKSSNSDTGLSADKSAEEDPFVLVICTPEQVEWSRAYLRNGPLIMDSTFGTNVHMVSTGLICCCLTASLAAFHMRVGHSRAARPVFLGTLKCTKRTNHAMLPTMFQVYEMPGAVFHRA